MKKRNKTIKFLKRVMRLSRNMAKTSPSFKPIYRVIQIEKDHVGDYIVTVQVIGKTAVFKMEPDKILADDAMVAAFSPIDIRTLTYLGYLDMHSPKYNILAKRLSQHSDQVLFAVQKKGEKDYKIVTSDEITSDKTMLEGLSREHAHMVGMTVGVEQAAIEKKQMEAMRVALEENAE
jgi:hypothetical protein